MFCSSCGANSQTANAYCKRCGEWLPEFKRKAIAFGGDTPQQNVFMSALSAVVALFSAIALYATYLGTEHAKWSIYVAAVFCLCIAGWQASSFAVALKRLVPLYRSSSFAQKSLHPVADRKLKSVFPRKDAKAQRNPSERGSALRLCAFARQIFFPVSFCAKSGRTLTGHLPLDASIRNQPHDGYTNIKKARDPRKYERQGDRYQIAHHRDLAFQVRPECICQQCVAG
jgi:hypothetical protein